MRLQLLASTGLAIVLLVAPAIAKGKSSGSSPTHTVGDNTGSGNSNAATTPQGDGDDAAGSAATYNSVSSSWTGNIKVRSQIQVDATGHTFGEDIDSDQERRQTDAQIGDVVHAKAGKYEGNPTASSSGTAYTLAKTHKPNGKDASVAPPAHAGASAVGGKNPTASAYAKTGKEKITVAATAGGKVSGTGGKQVVLHPKAGETVVVEYTRHTEGVAISFDHRAEAYAAAAKGGHVYVGATLIDAARAAAYAFAEAWGGGAYAYSKAESSATATTTDGFDHSHADGVVEAEAAIWQGGSVLHIQLPHLPNLAKLHIPASSTASKVQPDGVNLLIQRDPELPRMFCMAKRIEVKGGHAWGLACASADHMPSQQEIQARLHAGWTEIVTAP